MRVTPGEPVPYEVWELEIGRRDLKLARLRDEVKRLNRRLQADEAGTDRKEAKRYRKALSYIAFAPEPKNDPVEVAQRTLLGADTT